MSNDNNVSNVLPSGGLFAQIVGGFDPKNINVHKPANPSKKEDVTVDGKETLCEADQRIQDATYIRAKFAFTHEQALAFMLGYKAALVTKGTVAEQMRGEALYRHHRETIIGVMGDRYCPGIPFGVQLSYALSRAANVLNPAARFFHKKKEGIKSGWSKAAPSREAIIVHNWQNRLRVECENAKEHLGMMIRARRQTDEKIRKEWETAAARNMVSSLMAAIRYTETLEARQYTPDYVIPWADLGLSDQESQIALSEIALAQVKNLGEGNMTSLDERTDTFIDDVLGLVLAYRE